MADMINIMNTILANGSTEYVSRVPLATRTNIESVGAPIISYSPIRNEFLGALINKIVLEVIHNKTFNNPLSVLKRGTIPLGSDIQEIITNPAIDQGFDPSGSKLLTRTLPDVKTLFHRKNREGQYGVTISNQQLRTAFTSWEKLEELMNGIINTLYSGDNRDEFILMKNVFADALTGTNKMVKTEIVKPSNTATGSAFVKAVRNASAYMTYPSSSFNTYFANKPSTDTGKPLETWTPKEDQILIIRSDVLTEIDVDVLAQAFNMDKTSLLAKTLEIDTFGSATNCLGVLCDRSWLQVYDNLYEMTDFYNAQGLYHNFWLNHWQTYSFSYFANAIGFMDNTVVPPVEE